MKLLLVTHRYPPDGIAGVEVYTQSLARAFAKQGHQVTVLTGPGANSSGTDENVEIVHRGVRQRQAFRTLLARVAPDLIHYQHLSNHTPGYVGIAARAGIPQVMTLHDYWALCPRVQMVRPDLSLCDGPHHAGVCGLCLQAGTVLQRFAGNQCRFHDPAELPEAVARSLRSLLAASPSAGWYRAPHLSMSALLRQRRLARILRQVQAVIAPGATLAGMVQRHIAIPITVLPNPVDEPVRPAGTPPAEFTVGYAGSLDWHKGVHVLIRAVNAMRHPVRLEIHGHAENSDYLRFLRSIADPARVTFAGAFAPAERDTVYARFSVLVVPSLWHENCPLVIREALARHLPVITSDLPALREACPAEPPLPVFPPGNSSALCELLDRLACSPALTDTLRRAISPPAGIGSHLAALAELYQNARRAHAAATTAGSNTVPPAAHVTDCARLPKIRSAETLWRENGDRIAQRLADEQQLNEQHQTLSRWSVPGECTVCGTASEFTVDPLRRAGSTPNYRESLFCRHCGLNARQRLVMSHALHCLAAGAVRSVYLPEALSGFHRLFHQVTGERFPGVAVTASEYFGPGIEPGSRQRGIRHEDLLCLSFPSAAFDLVIANDVLEHIADIDAALREIRRIIRPGGRLLLTVPFTIHLPETRQRATVAGGAVVHHAPPLYHDNPLASGGSLVTYDFGWDLLHKCRTAGFADAYALDCYDRARGYIGHHGVHLLFLAEA